MSNKKYEIYNHIFSSIYNKITQNKLYDINIESKTTDAELSLIKALKDNFQGLNILIVITIINKT